MKTNETIKWQEEQALQRYQLIAPLLDESLDNAKRIQLREEAAEQNGLSPRTLYRYEAAYRKGGFPGLKPQDRESKRSPKLPENFDELLEQAIQLKREVPKRSVRQIIYILELEGRVAPGVLKRSTMERYLYKAGFGVRQMQMYNDARKSSSKRFCKPHRMMLIEYYGAAGFFRIFWYKVWILSLIPDKINIIKMKEGILKCLQILHLIYNDFIQMSLK